MKILLFGGSGQLGREIVPRAEKLDFTVRAPVRSEVDLRDGASVSALITRFEPELVINSAAYTAVDLAETNEADSLAINAKAPEAMAEACKKIGARLFHISTDYVFSGDLGRPLREDDPVSPLNLYGKSKRQGEELVLQTLPEKSLIVRTSSLHGAYGINFVHTMLKLFEERSELRVVADQIMSPTWAGWLAEALLDLARIPATGIVHASCRGALSWFEFAQTIYQSSGTKKTVSFTPITAAEFNRPARRPNFSVFDTTRLASLLGREPISWQDGLNAHLADLKRLSQGVKKEQV